MYLSYYQHPELQLLDEDRCEEYIGSKKCELWLLMDAPDEKEMFTDTGNHDSYSRKEFIEYQRNAFINGMLFDRIKNVYYPSYTFIDALFKSSNAFDEMRHDVKVFQEVHEDCCIIFGKKGETKMFLISDGLSKEDPDAHNYILMKTQMNGVIVFYAEFGLKVGAEHPLYTSFIYRPSLIEHQYDEIQDLWYHIDIMYSILIFKRYSDVELEEVCREKTLKKSNILHEKVNNFMGINVTLLDSNWFTTICRNEGFAVRGHFRLQPYKNNGKWDRKLIYINPFTKNGYHKTAKIQALNNT